MRIHIATLFPEAFNGPFQVSMIQRAKDQGLLDIRIYNIREYAVDKHHIVDDAPYGGGPGMVMKPEPIFACVEAIQELVRKERGVLASTPVFVVLLSPQGQTLSQPLATDLARHDELIFICGHYEGVDDRVGQYLANLELSIGDYVLTGGEPAAIVAVDAVTRLIPGFLGGEDSGKYDSHSTGILQHPQYTRPSEFRGWKVPEVLFSGDHGQVNRWRRLQSLLRTGRRRPDLLNGVDLTPEERKIIEDSNDE